MKYIHPILGVVTLVCHHNEIWSLIRCEGVIFPFDVLRHRLIPFIPQAHEDNIIPHSSILSS